jgi:hypothetical protein
MKIALHPTPFRHDYGLLISARSRRSRVRVATLQPGAAVHSVELCTHAQWAKSRGRRCRPYLNTACASNAALDTCLDLAECTRARW